MQKKDFGLNRLIEIMDELRVKCPWDKKQTLQTLRYLTIEEVYELSDAILKEDMSEIKNELGDLLLHIVFYSKIASEKNKFDIKDVISTICEKLIYRHPHIYKNTKVNDEVDVKLNWEKLKMKSGKKSVLEGVPKSLPSLVKAYRIQEKVKGIGFKWENKDQSWKKVIEEFEELKCELVNGEKDKIEEEFGDLLFSLVNYAQFININPEDALEKTNIKFIKRYKLMENLLKQKNIDISDLDIVQMEKYWGKAKDELRS